MKKFIVKLLLFLPVFIIVVLINLTYDPAHLFQEGKYERVLANYLLSGKNVANVTNYDVKLFQKYYTEGLKSRKGVVVLGSSRSLDLQKDLFPNKSFFNNSINGASIDDYRYVYDIYLKQNLAPRQVIIGLDPWILNKNKYSQIGSGQNTLFQKVIGLTGFKTANLESLAKYYQLISPSYFQSSFSLFLKGLTQGQNSEDYFVIDNPTDQRIVRFADGSMNLKSSYDDDPQKVRSAALTYDPVPLLGSFEELDPQSIENLESLISLLQKNGSEPIFYLPPYHPLTYQNLISSDKYKIIVKVQDYFINLAREKRIKVYGSYNPKDFQLQETDFYDGSHPKESATIKIFAQTPS